MSVVLRKMTGDEFDVFYRECIDQLTQELMEELNLSYQEANEAAIKEFTGIVTDGLQTKNNFPMVIVEEDSGDTVGFVCVLYKGEDDDKMNFIYNLSICEDKRRKGYATTALNLIEKMAAEAGCLVSILFVKDSNTGARALYSKLGYRDYKQDGCGKYMLKELNI